MFKLTKKILASLFILAGIIIFISCQEEPTLVTPDVGQRNLSKVSTLVIPAGATVDEANLKLYAWSWAANPQTVEIHNITGDWSCPVTWFSFAGAFDPAVITTFNAGAASPEWKTIDITSTVQGWVTGNPNFGLLMKNQDATMGLAQFLSVENIVDPLLAPYLEVKLSTGEIIKVEPLYDTYINSLDDYVSYCTEPTLYCGMNDLGTGPAHKYPLIRFDIEPTGGCTLTPGYWKTHSIYGPAPYDDTWALLLPSAETSPFFLSGKNYFQVLTTSPAGNAYYILSFQYIAAELNKLNGADFSAAQTAFTTATTLFNTYTPAQIGAMRGSNPVRQQFVALGTILDNYNNGLIGPGHCD